MAACCVRSPSASRVAYRGLLALILCAGAAVDSAAQSQGPILRVTFRYSTEFVFTPGSPPVEVGAVYGEPVAISWEATASAGRTLDRVRYGWDITDPDDDEQWQEDWCATCRMAPPRILHPGIYRFYLEARDSAGETTLARLDITVLPLAVQPASWSGVKARFAR